LNNRRKFLAAGGALAALAAVPAAKADPPQARSIYLHGMVWNRQLPAPMGDWLIRFDANAYIPLGNAGPLAVPGFATLGDDFHDPVGSHVQLHTATIEADQLNLAGTITESKNPALVGQPVRIQGKVVGTSVEGLTIAIGDSVFVGGGLVVIAIIAILIGLLIPA
jgi:hypothetical protein